VIEDMELPIDKHSKIFIRQWRSNKTVAVMDVIDGDDRAEVYIDTDEAIKLRDWLEAHLNSK